MVGRAFEGGGRLDRRRPAPFFGLERRHGRDWPPVAAAARGGAAGDGPVAARGGLRGGAGGSGGVYWSWRSYGPPPSMRVTVARAAGAVACATGAVLVKLREGIRLFRAWPMPCRGATGGCGRTAAQSARVGRAGAPWCLGRASTLCRRSSCLAAWTTEGGAWRAGRERGAASASAHLQPRRSLVLGVVTPKRDGRRRRDWARSGPQRMGRGRGGNHRQRPRPRLPPLATRHRQCPRERCGSARGGSPVAAPRGLA